MPHLSQALTVNRAVHLGPACVAYRKLGINNKAQLARLMAGSD